MVKVRGKVHGNCLAQDTMGWARSCLPQAGMGWIRGTGTRERGTVGTNKSYERYGKELSTVSLVMVMVMVMVWYMVTV